MKLKAMIPKDRALLGVMFGKTRVGKSGVCGTLGKPTMYLHTPQEGHGASIAAKVASECYPEAGVYPVNLGIAEEGDLDLGLIKDKKELGRVLSNDEIWVKLLLYINECPKDIGAIVVDSITDLCNIISETREFEKNCTKKDGIYNKFKERASFETMFHTLIDCLNTQRDKGKDCICTVAASYTYNVEGQPVGLKPEVAMFGIADTILKCFPDVFPVDRVVVPTEDGGEREVIAFVMNMRVGKTQYKKDEKTKKDVKKDEIYATGRITSYEISLPLGLEVGLLKADFAKIKETLLLLQEQE